MRVGTIYKLGGCSLVLGSTLLFVYSVSFMIFLPMVQIHINPLLLFLNTNWIWIATVAFIGLILMIFGFSAVYLKMYLESGVVGLLGYIFIVMAYILQVCKVTWEIFLWPVISGNQNSLFLLRDFVLQQSANVVLFKIISSIMILIGIVLFCAALYRSKVFPRYAAFLVFIGAFLYGLGPLISIIAAICGISIFAVGCSILGLNLIRNERINV
jgi:hypothetical protein